MTNPIMPAVMVEQELGKSIKINTASGPLAAGRYEVNIDNASIKQDPTTGVLSTVGSAVTPSVAAGHQIATITDPAAGTSVVLNETTTTLTATGDGFQYVSEDGTVTPVTFTLNTTNALNPTIDVKVNGVLVAALPTNQNDIHIDYATSEWNLSDDNITITETDGTTQTLHFPYRVTATVDSVTKDISLFQDGVLVTLIPHATVVAVAAAVVSGHPIATVTIDGVATVVNETVTSLGLTGSILTYTDEAGVATALDMKNAETTTTYVDAIAGTKHKVGTYTNEDLVATDVNETLTGIALSGQVINYTDEAGTVTSLDVRSAETTTTITNTVTGNKIATYTDEDLGTTDIKETVTTLAGAYNPTTGELTLTYVNEGNSQLPVVVPMQSVTVAHGVTGHKIFDVTTNGVVTDFFETITLLGAPTYDVATGNLTLTYTGEDGNVQTQVVNIPSSALANTITGHQIGTLTINGVAVPINETVTAYTTAVTGTPHKVGTYTDEAGTVTDVSETVTTLGALSFDIPTGMLTLPYTDEAGTTVTRSVQLHFDRYKTTSTQCVDIALGTATFQVDIGLAYTPEQDIIMYHDAANHMYGQVVTYDPVTGTLVVDVQLIEGAGNYCSWTMNLDAVAAKAETVTTLTNTVTGHLIGSYHNENSNVVDINETVTAVTGVLSAGHDIATYTNEAGVAVTVKESVTLLGTPTFDAATGTLTLTFTDEAGTVNTKSVVISAVALSGTASTGHTIGTITVNGVSTDIKETVTTLDGVSIAGQVLTITYIGEDGVTQTKTVTLPSDVVTTITNTVTGHKIATYTNESGTATDVNETITLNTALVATGHDIATLTNEAGTTTTLKETVTTVTGTVAGHTIGTFNAEDGTATAIKETVTSVGTPTVSAGVVTLPYTDEAGNVTNASFGMISADAGNTIIAGSDGKLFHAATALVNDDQVLSGDNTGNVTLTLTPTTVADSAGGTQVNYSIKGSTKIDGVTIVEDPTTHVLSSVGTVVSVSSNVATGHEVGKVYVNGTPTSLNETITTLSSALATGHTIGTYTNEAGIPVDLKETTTSLSLAGSVLTYTDEAGVATPLTLPAGGSTVSITQAVTAGTELATVTIDGVPTKIYAPVGKVYAQTVYTNGPPATATIFDLNNPPATNDNSLKLLDNAIYIDTTTGLAYYSDGTSYFPEVAPASTEWYLKGTTIDAGSNKTAQIQHNADIFVGAASTPGLVAVGHGGSSVINNTRVGRYALDSNTTGSSNTAIGNVALSVNTTGANNTALGANTLNSNTTGDSNTATGGAALQSNTTGRANTATGQAALNLTTTGGYNTAIGASALPFNTTGSSNSALGVSSLLRNTTGSSNTAVGNGALNFNTTGGSNVAVGIASLYSNAVGASSTAVGNRASQFTANANSTVSVGAYALQHNQQALNTAVGYNSFNNYTELAAAVTVTALSATQITISPAMSPVPAAGTYVTVAGATGTTNSIAYFDLYKSYKVVNATTLEVVDPAGHVLGTTGTAGPVSVRADLGFTNSTALGFNAQPEASNQVALGDGNVTTLLLAGKVQHDITQMGNVADGTYSVKATTTAGNKVLTLVPGASDFAYKVYVNAATPATATIFDLANPPVTNNDALKNLDNAIYIGTDGSTWTSNGTTYSTYTAPAATEWYLYGTTTDAGADKTSQIQHNADIFVGGASTGTVAVGNGGGNVVSNTRVGYKALNANTTGTNNVASGFNALALNTTGSANTALGQSAMVYNLTGGYNVAAGAGALSNSNSSENVAVGYASQRSLNTGARNVSVGAYASMMNVVGDDNTSVGYSALNSSYGSKNTAVGRSAFDTVIMLSSSATLTALSASRVTISPAMSPAPAAGTYVSVNTSTGFANSINGLPTNTAWKVVDASTLELVSTSNITLGTTGTASPVFINKGLDFTNSTALGYQAVPEASNQVALGDTNVTTLLLAGKVQHDITQMGSVADGTYFVKAVTTGGNKVLTLESATGSTGDDVYINSTDPATATVFDTANPPVTNNNALKNVSINTYYGTDGSVWTWNGTAYVTKTFSFQGASDEFTATAGQTSFTLTGTPKGKVWMFRNGARLPNASFSVVGTTVTYVPANNGSASLGALVAGDIIDIDYVK